MHERQGNWGYYIDYSQTPRYEPYTSTRRLPESVRPT
jgi:hypothetical protein